jgi:hypothetical protein
MFTNAAYFPPNCSSSFVSLLESPADDPDWKLACNYMKLIAVSLTTKKVFIKENYNAMIDSLIGQIVAMLCA